MIYSSYYLYQIPCIYQHSAPDVIPGVFNVNFTLRGIPLHCSARTDGANMLYLEGHTPTLSARTDGANM